MAKPSRRRNSTAEKPQSVTADHIEAELVRIESIYATVEEQGDVIVVTGMIGSEGERNAAHEIVNTLAPNKRLIDNLEIVEVLPEKIEAMDLSEAAVGDFRAATPDTEDDEALEPGDFTDQHLITNPYGAAGPASVNADEEISEGDEAYVPPNDPVRDRDGEVLGGFQISSMDEIEVEPSALDGEPGDEAIADAVRRELREDSATTALDVQVTVSRGIVRLRGSVPSLDDAENAEEVAGRVPGVVEVKEYLAVENV